jgi:tRNA nucleotidyltransferase (CCA-adding enzyme)
MIDPATDGLDVYLVGGAVRDRLLGLPVRERDFVVVGSSPATLLARGFRQVGKDFPVFLHPVTKEEYALARTERKTAPGYYGFTVHAEPDVTLEQDLQRRDLTINALAEDAGGRIIDPYGGLADLEGRLLRHVSAAFAEDPVRILRAARFAARFAGLGFEIADETMTLMRRMVVAGEVDALVAERVWQEMVRALGEPRPSRFFEVLRACGALSRLLPELDRLWGVPQPPQWHPEIDTGVHVMMVLDMAAELTQSPEIRFATLCHDFGKGTTPPDLLPRHHGHEQRSVALLDGVCRRLRVPKRFCEPARITARYHGLVHKADTLSAKTLLDMFEGCDLFRRPERFEQMLIACEADFRGRGGFEQRDYPAAALLRRVAEAARGVDVGAVARAAPSPKAIPERIRKARLAAIRAAQRECPPGA